MIINITINLDDLENEDSYLHNCLGETLRDQFFDQSKGLGCYSSFDVKSDVIELESEPLDPNDISEYALYWKRYSKVFNDQSIEMRYYWDGDGVLEFILPNGVILSNGDCKKTYRWKTFNQNDCLHSLR